jgi:hypothetical protein
MSIFETEVREKKNQAYGNRAKTGRGSSKSRKGMNTPYDFMSKSEKEKLNGEVEVFNMHTVIPITEFNFKDEKTQKELLTKWREVYDNKHIMKELGVSNKVLYDLVKKLEIPKKTRVDTGERRTAKAKQAKPKQAPNKTLIEFAEEQAKLPDVKKEAKTEALTPVLTSAGWTLEYNNIYNEDELNTIFTKCQIMVEGEKRKFKLSLTLSEIR